MSFTRVEQDGLEFYTLKANGASGMSISALARLCRVNDKAIAYLLKQIARNNVRAKRLKPLVGKEIYLGTDLGFGARIIRAEICSGIIRYYAFESRFKNETAQYSFEKFAEMGIEAWIQSITGWTPALPSAELTVEAVEAFVNDFLPAGKLAVAIHPGEIIKLLQQSKFSADGYRLYFYLEMMHLQNEQPDEQHICDILNISMSTFKKWLPHVHEWSRCADWIEIRTRQGPEFDIQSRMHQELGGTIEVHTLAGRIDLVTDTEVIEIKRINHWKDAFGEVVVKGRYFPNHQKRIHLFGEAEKLKPTIITTCEGMDIIVTFEPTILESATTDDPWADAA
jgi:hypothetical protein